MTVINYEKNFIFVHPRRTGGSSLVLALLKFCSANDKICDDVLSLYADQWIDSNLRSKFKPIMKKKLNTSLKKDKRLFDVIIKNNPKIIIKKFIYSVQISKLKYLEMINNRYISTVLNFTDKEIINGLNEVIRKYKKILKFKDRLICFIIKK